MSNIIAFNPLSDQAFQVFSEARDKAIASGLREDAERARRLFIVFCETGVPADRRWPRDTETLRPLSPSEIARRGP